MTEEKQGGTTPATDAMASGDAQAPDRPAGAIAVADEPAQPAADETASPASEAPANEVDPTTDEAAPAAESAPVVESETAPDAEAPSATAEAAAPTTEDEAPVASSATSEAPVVESETIPEVEPAAPAEPAARAEPAAAEAEAATTADATSEAPAEPEAAPAPEPPPPPRDLGPEPTTMEELLAEQESDIKSFKHGDVVEGTVVRIDKDEILVDIGAKSEGVVSNRELFGRHGGENQAPLNIGDTVLVYVLQPESPEGHAVLSLRRAGLERKWRAMQEQFEAGVIIEAPVIDHNKGGLIVDCGIRGFVPISQIVDFPRRPQNDQPRDAAQEIAEKLQPFVGRKLRLKILEVNRKANRLILSEKVALYEERREKRDELFSSLQVGQKVSGTVRSIAPFGVFVDLGGIDGLVHKSELSWNKVNNPEGGYRVGEEVEAEVIDINHERGRISLSIRRLQPDPWHSTVADLKTGDVIDGTVTKIVNFGAFVRVRDGLEGLIHISELSHQRVAHPGDVVHEGQTIKLKIISLDQERHRLGLSLKQAEEAPARPEPTATATPSAPRERRPRGGDRGDRGGYDMSQAVQEPEGGIDTTLAAAFAGIREQLASAEAEDSSPAAVAEEAPAAVAEVEAPVADAPAADAPEAEAPAAEAEPEAPEAEAPAAEAEPEAPEAEAPAAEAAPDAAAEPEAVAEAPATADAEVENAPEPAADAPEAEAPAQEPAAEEPVAESVEEPAAEAAAEPAEDEKPAG